jgi:hypothetical protein
MPLEVLQSSPGRNQDPASFLARHHAIARRNVTRQDPHQRRRDWNTGNPKAMSLIKWFLSRAAKEPSSELPPAAEIRLTGNGGFRLMVVGEASYQDNLEQICGGRTTESVDRTETAHLILEDSNPYDRNAVSVKINDLQVGYLNREDAKAYRTYLQMRGQPNAIGACRANIRGGWKRKLKQGHFGVRLDFDLYG